MNGLFSPLCWYYKSKFIASRACLHRHENVKHRTGRGKKCKKTSVFKEPLNFQQAQGIRDKKENEVRRECRAERYLLLHQLVVCQRKQQKWGLEFARLHIRGGLPIPCLFSSEKLPCEEKHSFYYLWGQPLLFIMLMLLCCMPSTGPLFHRVFLCTEGEKERKHSNPPLPVCRIGEEIKVRVVKGGLSTELWFCLERWQQQSIAVAWHHHALGD